VDFFWCWSIAVGGVFAGVIFGRSRREKYTIPGRAGEIDGGNLCVLRVAHGAGIGEQFQHIQKILCVDQGEAGAEVPYDVALSATEEVFFRLANLDMGPNLASGGKGEGLCLAAAGAQDFYFHHLAAGAFWEV